MNNASLDDYRVGIDPEASEVVIIFTAEGVDMTVRLKAADTQKVIDALTRAVEQLRERMSKH